MYFYPQSELTTNCIRSIAYFLMFTHVLVIEINLVSRAILIVGSFWICGDHFLWFFNVFSNVFGCFSSPTYQLYIFQKRNLLRHLFRYLWGIFWGIFWGSFFSFFLLIFDYFFLSFLSLGASRCVSSLIRWKRKKRMEFAQKESCKNYFLTVGIMA